MFCGVLPSITGAQQYGYIEQWSAMVRFSKLYTNRVLYDEMIREAPSKQFS